MLESLREADLPYITNWLPGIGGRLRASPDYFVVEELPLYEAQGEGQHLYVCLTRTGLTTKEVQGHLEKLFDLRRGDVGFAGLKDKHARTTQTFSLSVGHQTAKFAEEAGRRIQDHLPVTVQWVRFHGNKLRPGHLLGNRFEITVTDLALEPDSALQQTEPIVQVIGLQGLPNYFGPQRFGHEGANVERGREILSGRRYPRDRWLRRFLVSSYQSYLCNRYLARRLNMGAFEHLLAGDVAKKYATGGIFDVEDLASEQLRYLAKEISFTAPLFGPKMKQAHHEAAQLEMSILNEGQVTMEQFGKARADGTRRLGRILVPDLEVALASQGPAGAITARFFLPKGAFATTVMRELMKVDLSSLTYDELDE